MIKGMAQLGDGEQMLILGLTHAEVLEWAVRMNQGGSPMLVEFPLYGVTSTAHRLVLVIGRTQEDLIFTIEDGFGIPADVISVSEK